MQSARASRPPAVAGRFYPKEPALLEAELVRCIAPTPPNVAPALMLMAPHAGYMYSGAIAGRTYARVRVPEHVVVLGPNHTGAGARSSIWTQGDFELPGGGLAVDEELAAELVAHAAVTPDHVAHAREHSIEVQLPFVRARNPEAKIVPLCLSGLSYEECEALGLALAHVIESLPPHAALLVASTDMSHYLPAATARELDELALDRVLALDPSGLYDTVQSRRISMCGFVPTTVALTCARALGATRAELVQYGNSGEVTRDFDEVVGYAGVVVS